MFMKDVMWGELAICVSVAGSSERAMSGATDMINERELDVH